MTSAANTLVVLFVGGPLNGTRHEWADPPDYHPHVTAAGMVPYGRTKISTTLADVVFAPVGILESAVLESLARLPQVIPGGSDSV